MNTYVVDTSVVLGWFDAEPKASDKDLFRLLTANKISLIAPDFLLSEVGNVLLNKKKYTYSQTDKIVTELINSAIIFRPFFFSETRELIKIAGHYGLSTYDGYYVRLAKKENCQLITADHKLGQLDCATSVDRLLKSIKT